jgi:hypothetical protein
MRLGMKIFLAPGDVLVPLRAGASMTARRLAADRTDKSAAAFADLTGFFAGNSGRGDRRGKYADRSASQQHAERLALAFRKMRLQRS